MRRKRSNWFTIVATDLFSSAFAAILLLDAVTPKETGMAAEAQAVRIEYSHIEGKCPNDPDAVILMFRDSGEWVSTQDSNLSASANGNTCVMTGAMKLFLAEEPTDACILITELSPPDPEEFSVMITGLGFQEQVKTCI